MNIAATVSIVDARKQDWEKTIAEELTQRRNFVAILNSTEDANKFAGMLNYSPQKLERFGIYALTDVLESPDYAMLLDLCGRFELRFVEQIKLPVNRPPATKAFVLYCELRGIISEHHSLEEATRTLMEYLHKFNRIKLFPLAGIYQFECDSWHRVRRFA